MHKYRHSFKSYFPAYFIFLLLVQTPLWGQVLVHQEPRHRPVFENKEIRILDVLFPPGDTTQYHVHTTPSVFINFTTTAVGSQVMGKEKTNSESRAGDILVEDLSGSNTRTHRVWNRDNAVFHVMDVELLYQDFDWEVPPLDLSDLKLEIDTTWVRVYRLNLSEGKQFQLEKPKQSFLLVSLQDASVEIESNGKSQTQNLKQGSFITIPRKKSFSINHSGKQPAQLVLLEFPK
ncbi:hypothetical protein D0X99_15300 [Algoriphagus lacus]|uniref:Cupin domain-containing protein n=1 Tax=Algoriphagus lacus TaxID=2056311 RepID=A0A418PNR9_9BACT|nr:hypothetical protein [Algoriphagus lacus]RIW13609.1 hypothetical protein D0X99_15300 [Algoriphagus lacus]